jgi:hypothetical protein
VASRESFLVARRKRREKLCARVALDAPADGRGSVNVLWLRAAGARGQYVPAALD